MTVLIDTNVFPVVHYRSTIEIIPNGLPHLGGHERQLVVEFSEPVGNCDQGWSGQTGFTRSADFFRTQVAKFYIEKVLPVGEAHVLADFELPRYHRDPFDRMLIAQAHVEGLPFVTCDREIHKYPIEILW